MKGIKSLQRRVTGNPENNIVYDTCRNFEINPSIEISLSSVTALCMSRCTRMDLLHAFILNFFISLNLGLLLITDILLIILKGLP